MIAIQIMTGEIIELENDKSIEGDVKWIVNPTDKEIKEIKENTNA
jgi:hypothetical protein